MNMNLMEGSDQEMAVMNMQATKKKLVVKTQNVSSLRNRICTVTSLVYFVLFVQKSVE